MRKAAASIACAVLALSACGDSQRATAPTAHHPVTPAVAAERDPQTLLGRVSLPAGAQRAPQLARGLLAGSIGGLSVQAHRLWRVPLPYGTVLRFFERQHPQGATSRSNLLVGRVRVFGKNRELTWKFRPIRPFIKWRMLSVVVLALSPAETGVRVEVNDTWTLRPAGERVPAGTRTITVQRPGWGQLAPLSRRITEPGQVARVVRWFDGLTLFTGAYGDCPAMVFGPTTVVRFLSATGGVLAEARVFGSGTGGACGSGMSVTVRGRPEPPLAGNFLPRVLALLGVPSGSSL